MTQLRAQPSGHSNCLNGESDDREWMSDWLDLYIDVPLRAAPHPAHACGAAEGVTHLYLGMLKGLAEEAGRRRAPEPTSHAVSWAVALISRLSKQT